MRPLVGVTGPTNGGDAAWWFARLAVYRAGGRAVRITPSSLMDPGKLNGLVIGGGADIDPGLYGQEKIRLAEEVVRKKYTFGYSLNRIFFYPLIYFLRKVLSSTSFVRTDKERDALEYYFLEKALKRKTPVLGICRGAQLINVHAGGSLYQELSQFYVETPQFNTVFPKKTVRISPNTLLARILKVRKLRVNALHRQAINKKGKNIRVSASESNGVVQAVEFTGRPFVVGVQWHPEYLPQHRVHQKIFHELVRAGSVAATERITRTRGRCF